MSRRRDCSRSRRSVKVCPPERLRSSCCFLIKPRAARSMMPTRVAERFPGLGVGPFCAAGLGSGTSSDAAPATSSIFTFSAISDFLAVSVTSVSTTSVSLTISSVTSVSTTSASIATSSTTAATSATSAFSSSAIDADFISESQLEDLAALSASSSAAFASPPIRPPRFKRSSITGKSHSSIEAW